MHCMVSDREREREIEREKERESGMIGMQRRSGCVWQAWTIQLHHCVEGHPSFRSLNFLVDLRHHQHNRFCAPVMRSSLLSHIVYRHSFRHLCYVCCPPG